MSLDESSSCPANDQIWLTTQPNFSRSQPLLDPSPGFADSSPNLRDPGQMLVERHRISAHILSIPPNSGPNEAQISLFNAYVDTGLKVAAYPNLVGLSLNDVDNLPISDRSPPHVGRIQPNLGRSQPRCGRSRSDVCRRRPRHEQSRPAPRAQIR